MMSKRLNFDSIALLIVALITGGMIFSGCDNYKAPELGRPKAGGVYIAQALESPIPVELSNLKKADTLVYSANIGGVGSATKDVVIHFQADASLVNAYNTEHSTSYEALPEGNYDLSLEKDTIKANVKYGNEIALIIKNHPHDLDVSKKYLLPITLKQVNNGLSINKNLQTAYFVINNSYYNRPAGSGTLTDPYLIATLDNLQWINQNEDSWDGYFVQTEDIDASDTKNWNNGEGFIPIGNDKDNAQYFEGSYDGQGHTIKGLYINRPKTAWVGMFCRTDAATTIENLELKDVDITALDDVGGVVGLHYGVVKNVKVSGQINGTDQGDTYDNIGGVVGSSHGDVLNSEASADVIGHGSHVGGLVGYTDDNTVVKNSHASGDVTSVNHEVGGLVGDGHGSIVDCYATGDVHSDDVYAGGLVGINYGPISGSYATGDISGAGNNGGLVGDSHGPISHCYATGDVKAEGHSNGGLVGYITGAGIEYSYATGDVQTMNSGNTGGLAGYVKNNAPVDYCFSTGDATTGGGYAGGLIADTHSSVSNSYATGNVSTADAKYAGGVVGQFLYGTLTNCYATGTVNNPTGTTEGVAGNAGSGAKVVDSYWDTQTSGISSSSNGGTGLTTSQMQGTDAQTNMSGFDFGNVWQTQSGDYPILKDNQL